MPSRLPEQTLGNRPLTPELPAYLAEPRIDGRTYGTLEWDKTTKSWVMTGEPRVIQIAKRLFPGSSGRGQGIARFPANRRNHAELNWFMLRYPLKIADTDRWAAARAEAVAHALWLQQINDYPEMAVPPASFIGQLLPFQQEGLSYLLKTGRCLLADSMGLGKTPVSLAWFAGLDQWPALIVVMPHLVRQWVAEINKFMRLDPPGQRTLLGDTAKAVHVIRGLKPGPLPTASIYIIHYLLLRGWKNVLPKFGFHALVFDEIQELRHRGTEKYSAASLLAEKVPNVIGLSGTPIYNQGGEIWNVMNILDYHCLGDWDSFTREWCHGYGNESVVHPEVLGSYLRSEGLLLRRTKEQVLDQLPPKRRVIQEIDMDQGLYGTLIGPAVKAAQKIKHTTDFTERGRLTREAISETRRATGIAKAKHVCAFVRALLEAGETVLLGAYHHDVWAVYEKELKQFKPAKITGKETGPQKDEAARRFMSGETDLVLLSLRAAAGLNLQRARCVVAGELDWSPAIHQQLEDRAHRMGQQDSVLCYYLVAPEGTDQDMMEALGLKVSQFIGIVGDKTESEEDRLLAESAASEHMRRVIERLQQRSV